MNRSQLLGTALAAAIIVACIASAQAPSQDGAAGSQDGAEPVVVTEALDRIGAAYARLRSLRLEATVTGDYDAAGRKAQHELKYTAALSEDGRFKHVAGDELVVASDAEATYVYFPKSLRYYRTAHDKSTTRPALRGAAREALVDHNPSLALALSEDAAQTLRSWGPLEAGPETLTLVQKRSDASVWTLVFDGQSALLREVRIDERAKLAEAGVPNVTAASRRIQYTVSQPDADVPDDAVAFAPSELAQEVEPSAVAGRGSLVGREAPELELPDLEAKVVTLASLRGKVVLVDFWASWCPPCVAAAAHIKGLAEAHAEDLVVLAVNLQEEPQTIGQFVADHELAGPNIHVLRDAQGTTAQRFGVTAIPFSVVVGRDGTVREVILGLQPEKLQEAINAAIAR